jgi:hypothetical protein
LGGEWWSGWQVGRAALRVAGKGGEGAWYLDCASQVSLFHSELGGSVCKHVKALYDEIFTCYTMRQRFGFADCGGRSVDADNPLTKRSTVAPFSFGTLMRRRVRFYLHLAFKRPPRISISRRAKTDLRYISRTRWLLLVPKKDNTQPDPVHNPCRRFGRSANHSPRSLVSICFVLS